MNVSGVQSQSNIFSVVSSKTLSSSATQTSGQSIGARAANLLEMSNQIDPGFARSVLQDTVEKRLETALSEAGLDISAQEILTRVGDASPEATAQGIVEFATSFLEQHKANHSDLESKQQVEEFAALIKGAIETGFEEAAAMLSQLGHIPGAVQANVDETFDLVQRGIDVATETLASISESDAPADGVVGEDPTSVI